MNIKNYIRICLCIVFCIFLSSCKIDIKNPNKDNDAVIVNNEKENVLNLGITGIDTLNPLFTSSSSVYKCMQLIYEPLFSFDDTLNPVGVLAKSCIASEDSMTYTIELKDGILWHDGTAFNSQDVIHTINLIRFNNTSFTKSFSCVGAASVIDDYTVSVKLSRPVPNFTSLLSFPIVKRTVSTENIDNFIPVGTGPYKYNNKASSDRISLTINENFHKELPTIKEIYVNILKDKEALSDAFNASEIDIITSDEVDLNKNTPEGNISIADYVTNNMVFVGINNSDKILNGSSTRKALSYLINKDEIVTTEIFSRAVRADVPVNPSSWYYPKTAAVDYDSEYIREVLSLDGWKKNEEGYFVRQVEKYEDGQEEPIQVTQKLKLEIIVNDDNEERYRLANKIGNALNNYGIQTEITFLSFQDYTRRINEKEYQLFVGEMVVPYNMDQYSIVCDVNNYFSCSEKSINDIVYRLGTTKNDEEQKAVFEEYLKVFNDEMPFIPLFFRKASVIAEKSLSGTSMPTIFSAYNNPEGWYLSQKNKQLPSDDKINDKDISE